MNDKMAEIITNLMIESGLPYEDAKAEAHRILALPSRKKGTRADDRVHAKHKCERMWTEGYRTLTVQDLADYFLEALSEVRDPKSLGDLLGRGRGGLYLKKLKVSGETCYEIPAPDSEKAWYEEQNAHLSAEYFGPEYLNELRKMEIDRKDSTFFRDRNRYFASKAKLHDVKDSPSEDEGEESIIE